jgi:hypothetical protein
VSYGRPRPPVYDLTQVHVPTAVIYGGCDTLVDCARLVKLLPNCVYSEVR